MAAFVASPHLHCGYMCGAAQAGVTEVIPHGQGRTMPHSVVTASTCPSGGRLSARRASRTFFHPSDSQWCPSGGRLSARRAVRPRSNPDGACGIMQGTGGRHPLPGRPPVARSGLVRDGTAKLARDGHGSDPCQIREMVSSASDATLRLGVGRLGTPACQADTGLGIAHTFATPSIDLRTSPAHECL